MKKRTIITSILTLLLCVSIFTGATFALFTDQDQVNIAISSGNVEVVATIEDLELYSPTLVNLDGTVLNANNAATSTNWFNGGTAVLDGKKLTLTNITPGDSAKFNINVENKSNVNVQYRVNVAFAGELADALVAKVTLPGGAETKLNSNGTKTNWTKFDDTNVVSMPMSVELPLGALNAAKGKNAEVIVTVEAVQGNAASVLAMNGVVYNSLNEAIEAAVGGEVITVDGTVDYFIADVANQNIDFKNVTIKGTEGSVITFKNAEGSTQGGANNHIMNVNLEDITVVDDTFYTAENGENAWEFTYLEFGGTSTFTNVVFEDGIILDDVTATAQTFALESTAIIDGDFTFTNCTFYGHNNDSSEYGNATMYAVWVSGGTSTFTNCTFTGTRGLKAHEAYGSDIEELIVEDCKFINLSEKPGIVLGDLDSTTQVTFTNNLFLNTQPGDGATNATKGVKFEYETDTPVDKFVFNNTPLTEMTLNTVEELVLFSKTVNAGYTFAGKTVKLGASIDMAGVEYQPAGNVNSFPSVTFKGVFDGQNHTISNLTTSSFEPANATAGLFGSITGEVKNLTLDNANITSSHYAGGIVGYSYGAVVNCKVINSTITSVVEAVAGGYDNGDKVGGIVGYLASESTAGKVDKCTVENTTINAYRDLGGIVGYAGVNSVVTNNKATDVTLVIDKDPEHNYKNYTQDAEHDLGQIVGETVSSATVENNTAVNVTETEKYVIKTAEELKTILLESGQPNAGNAIIELAANVDLTDQDWTPVVIKGYQGADIVTLNGNGNTITGLSAPLFAGGFAGGSGIVINDLTIKDSNIVSANTLGSGAFIECVDSMDIITLNNCHLLNSTLTGSRSGGLVGWTSGYNNENDGAVKTYVTFENCSVIGCTINGGGESVGAINGHAGANPWTFTTIKDCVIKGNTLVGGTGKTGVVLGTANLGEVTVSGCEIADNTVNGVASDAVYGRTSFGETGKLTIDGNPVA